MNLKTALQVSAVGSGDFEDYKRATQTLAPYIERQKQLIKKLKAQRKYLLKQPYVEKFL